MMLYESTWGVALCAPAVNLVDIGTRIVLSHMKVVTTFDPSERMLRLLLGFSLQSWWPRRGERLHHTSRAVALLSKLPYASRTEHYTGMFQQRQNWWERVEVCVPHVNDTERSHMSTLCMFVFII